VAVGFLSQFVDGGAEGGAKEVAAMWQAIHTHEDRMAAWPEAEQRAAR